MKKQLKWMVETYIEGFIFMLIIITIIYGFVYPYTLMTLKLSSFFEIGTQIVFIGFYFIYQLFWLFVKHLRKTEATKS